MRRSPTPVLSLLVLLVAAGTAQAAVPQRIARPALPAADLEVRSYALPPAAALAAADKAAAGGPYRFAIPAETALTPRNAGRWTRAGGQAVWRLRLVSRGALSLNLAFVTCDLPPGGTLVLRPTAGGDGWLFRAEDLAPGQPLWTPVVLTDDLVVEVACAPGDQERVALELARVNQGYRWFGEDDSAKAGACNVDVVCPEGDGWRDEIRAVGVYTLSGSFKCTGAMVNNTARDATPLFLTAEHCAVTEFNDQSLVVYWNFESPSCGDHGGGSLDDNQSGATWRASSATSDFCLVELDDAPDPAWGVTFAGWNRADAAPSSAVTIHHPSTDEKSISFDEDPLTITSYSTSASPGDGTHLRVGAWDLGTTEPGSSGSPLFGPDHRVVGQLHGGFASCVAPDQPDWYGRLAVSWTGGGTTSTSLASWLDPGDTGALTTDLYDPATDFLTVAPMTPQAFSGPVGGPFAPTEIVYTLTNAGTGPLAWTATASASWLGAAPASGTLDGGAQTQVTVSPSAAAAALGRGVRTARVVFATATPDDEDVVVDVSLTALDSQPFLVRVGPNPFRGFTTITYAIGVPARVHGRVYDLRGRLAADLGVKQADPGENIWGWNGRDGAGRHQPGGTYVLELEADGRTLRVPLTVSH